MYKQLIKNSQENTKSIVKDDQDCYCVFFGIDNKKVKCGRWQYIEGKKLTGKGGLPYEYSEEMVKDAEERFGWKIVKVIDEIIDKSDEDIFKELVKE